MTQLIVGVMDPSEGVTDGDTQVAFELGRRVAQAGWVLLTGGRNTGVMGALAISTQLLRDRG